MRFLYSIFFGAGVAAIAYATMGRRVGYGNSSNILTLVAVVFVLVTLLFFTAFSFFFPAG